MPDVASDVLVLGGGPAGCAAAVALRRAGLSAAVVEREREPRARPGESLAPSARRPLEALGLWEAFRADGHAPAQGQRALWGAPVAREGHFMRDPDGSGWHLDRARFEALLRRAAERAGASLLAGHEPAAISWDGRRWRLLTAAGTRVEARFALDAGGRGAPLARRAGARRVLLDRLVGVTAFLAPGRVAFDHFTLVEAVEDGWWYSAPLPDARRVLAFFTDADLAAGARTPEGFAQRLRRAPATAARCGGAAGARRALRGEGPRIVAAHSSRLTAVASDGWLAVGDAAASFDPLSSQGLETALGAALDAAETVARHLRGERGALDAYAARVLRGWRRYVYERARVYEQETRWSESPFWARRQAHRTRLAAAPGAAA